jgi:uncharacterized protein involved in exopolysaccharide biosynthesis
MAGDTTERLIAVWQVAQTKRRAIARIVLVAGLVSTVIALLTPKNWKAQASFFPESRSSSTDLTAGLGGLAGLLGMAGNSLSMGRPSQFFADLIKSRTFQDSLAMSVVPVDSLGTMVKVEDYLVKRAKNAKLRRWKARNMVKRAIRVTTLQSGVVVLAVTTKSPYASAAIANRAIEVIDELNIAFRHREATARRRFTETFLEDVEARLATAEDGLERFLEANRTFVTPALMRKRDALQVDVDRLRTLKQQLETTIENARLSEFNDAAVVATVDVATVGPRRMVIVAGGVLLALMGVFWALYLRIWR